MAEYTPERNPDPKQKPTGEIHHDIDDITGDGFDGIGTVGNGVVVSVVGNLTDDDVSAIEDYLGVPLIERE